MTQQREPQSHRARSCTEEIKTKSLMIRNILLVAYRSLTRQFSYSVINILGLAIGIACSLVIFLFVYGEWSYDRHFAKGDRIYRIGVSFFNIGKFAPGPEELLDVLPKEYAGVETATRVQKGRSELVTINDQTYTEPYVLYTDTAFFKMFDFNFKAGNRENVLAGPNDVVLTDVQAVKYFGKTDVIGEVLLIGKSKTPFTVTGVVEEPTFNTHLKSPMWLSLQGKISGSPVWSSAAFHNYVLLNETQTEADLRTALDHMIETHVFPESGKPMGYQKLEDYVASDNSVKFYVHSLKDIYLQSKLNAELVPGGNESNIYIFSAISVFIMVLAAVNFVNLTTARASRRAKEVGIRKTMGTSRSKLIAQFLLESVMMSTVSMILSLFLAELFLILFQYVTGTPLLTSLWQNPETIFLFVGFSLFVGFVSGLYPAFYLTSFTPVNVLKGNTAAAGGVGFRNVLVVFQFSVSIVLIISAGIVQQQLHFISVKDLGFSGDNVVTIDHSDVLGTSADAYKEELSKYAGVIGSSYHVGEPGSKRILTFNTFQTPAMTDRITINTYFGDADYLSLLGMRLVQGRGFDKNLASDTLGVILNEAAVKALGIEASPIGQKLNENQVVIGVVSDFHWESLRTAIAPAAIILNDGKHQLGFKLQAGAANEFLKVAEANWKTLAPDETFSYHFVDDNFGEIVKKEAVFGKAITVFTLLAIFISCLGLYGLSAYTAEQRTKEIGIRKVLGASVTNIVVMLNRKFTRLVLVAAFISVPLAFYMGTQWLEGFAYRISLGAGLFALSIGLSLLIAWLTVGYHSLKASRVNPSETLKYE